jgi:hypothetical protein
MAFKSLEDTFIYRHLNEQGLLTKKVANILQHGQVLKQSSLDEAFMIINKNFKFPLKYRVMDEIQSGDIILMYSPDNTKVPTCLPSFLSKSPDGRIIAVVLVDIYGSMNKDNGNINIDPKKLYCLIESAYLSKLCYYYDKQISSRNVIITNGSAIYCNMFTRVLNKKYALNVDKTKMHKVLFLSSKFYMINVLGLPENDMTFNYAIKNCINGNPYSIKEVNDLVKLEDFKDLSTFILALSKQETGLGMTDLTVRNYLESFINMYDASALLALEAFPYFLYNVMSVTNGAYINNQYVLEDIVEHNGAKMYADLINMDK